MFILNQYSKQLKILKLSDIYQSQIGKFMFSFKKGLLADSFSELFLLTNQIHHYNTRKSFYLLLYFTYFLVQQISDSSQYASKDPNCWIISIQKFRMLTVFLNLSLN